MHFMDFTQWLSIHAGEPIDWVEIATKVIKNNRPKTGAESDLFIIIKGLLGDIQKGKGGADA